MLRRRKAAAEDTSFDEDPEEVPVEFVGEPIEPRQQRKRGASRSCYRAFRVGDVVYETDNCVLAQPENKGDKPYLAMIKEIFCSTGKQAKGEVSIAGQWFYRPEDAKQQGTGVFEASDPREIYLSFHTDKIPACSIMHKCQVYFLAPGKELPRGANGRRIPGFVVRQVYDAKRCKLSPLTATTLPPPARKEIKSLLQRTEERIGPLLDLDAAQPATAYTPASALVESRKAAQEVIVIDGDEDDDDESRGNSGVTTGEDKREEVAGVKGASLNGGGTSDGDFSRRKRRTDSGPAQGLDDLRVLRACGLDREQEGELGSTGEGDEPGTRGTVSGLMPGEGSSQGVGAGEGAGDGGVSSKPAGSEGTDAETSARDGANGKDGSSWLDRVVGGVQRVVGFAPGGLKNKRIESLA